MPYTDRASLSSTVRIRRVAGPDHARSTRAMPRQIALDEGGRAAGTHTGAEARSEGRVGRRAQLTGDIIDVPRRGTSGPRLRPARGQAQMPQDAFHDTRVLDQREQPQPAATARAVEHVDPKRPLHELGPHVAARTPSSCRIMSYVRDRTHGGRRIPTIPSRRTRRRPHAMEHAAPGGRSTAQG